MSASAPAIKKNYNRFQQKEFDRKANARRANLPALIEERYGIKLSGGSSDNRDADGHGFRLGKAVSNGEKIWLANGSVVGDAVQAVQQLDSKYLNKMASEKEAIATIESFGINKGVAATSNSDNKEHKPFRFTPPSGQDKAGALFEYVTQERGISWNTVNAAENAGFLDKGVDGLRFLGRDENGNVKSAETRLFAPANGQSKIRCVAGSDRSYPAILRGQDHNEVHVVEGGTSALGLYELLRREGKDPTIIVTGGKDNLKWSQQPHIQKILQGASVTVWQENEDDETKQQATNEAAGRQANVILKEGAAEVTKARPPADCKDTADWNKQQKMEMHQRQERSKSH